MSLREAREILRATRLGLVRAPLASALGEASGSYSVEALTMARGYLVRAIVARGIARRAGRSLLEEVSEGADGATQAAVVDEALVLADPPPETHGTQLVREIAAMLRALRETAHLPERDERRLAALAEKRRILAAVEAHDLAAAPAER